MAVEAEIADDLMSSFEEHYDELQYSLNRLIHHPEDAELVNVIFRAMHTVKGNAAMVQLQELVNFTHAMEETISAMRSGNFEATEHICDLLLVGMDRLRDLHQLYLYDKATGEEIDEEAFAQHFITLSQSNSQSEAEANTQAFRQMLYPEITAPDNETEANVTENTDSNGLNEEQVSDHKTYLTCSDEQYSDLEFFQDLAKQIDRNSVFWQGRTERLIYLGIKLCELSTEVNIDRGQLVAAIYMHDVGMAFLPNELINKQSKLNAMELKRLKKHVDWGHKMLVRMPTWQEAASMVLQHHEHEDGTGYPNSLSGDQLNEGSKIIAILDAFYAMTNLRSDRNHRRSILRAISEINACTGTQFNEYWVGLFNQVIRNEVKNGNI